MANIRVIACLVSVHNYIIYLYIQLPVYTCVCRGLLALWRYMESEMGMDPGPVWERIKDVVIKTIIRYDGKGGGEERRGGRVNCSIVICQTAQTTN